MFIIDFNYSAVFVLSTSRNSRENSHPIFWFKSFTYFECFSTRLYTQPCIRYLPWDKKSFMLITTTISLCTTADFFFLKKRHHLSLQKNAFLIGSVISLAETIPFLQKMVQLHREHLWLVAGKGTNRYKSSFHLNLM